MNLDNVSKSLSTYTRLLSMNLDYECYLKGDELFVGTLFDERLWGVLTCYLYDKTGYYRMGKLILI